MNKIISLILFVFTQQYAAFSVTDSLVVLKDLSFVNDVEKSGFLTPNNNDCLNFLLTSYDKTDNYGLQKTIKEIDDCVLLLQKEIQGKNETKRVKYVYEFIHKKFLKVYKLQNSFSDIFEKGEYNCVSASALYAIVFQKLGIPFQIKETPQHVYLITYPETFKILIETTIPDKGYFQFNDNYVEKYVRSLYDSKTISKEEYEGNSANDLFNKYYFSSTNISLKELAGLQYSNYALFALDDNKNDLALGYIKKAYFLTPSEKNKYILKSTLIYQVGNSDYSDDQQVQSLSMLCKYNASKDKEISNEFIKNEFARLTQGQLINNSNYEKFEKSHELIKATIKDTSLMNDVDFTYNYELGRLEYINSGNNKNEIKYLLAAYKINPKHATLQSMILGSFSKTIEKSNDAKFVLKLMDEYSSNFDFLQTNKNFNSVKTNCMLELSYQGFVFNDLASGERYLKQFEEICNKDKSLEPNAFYVEKAYSVAAGVYYKKGNSIKAKQLIKTGLIYAPDSFGLKQRLSQL